MANLDEMVISILWLVPNMIQVFHAQFSSGAFLDAILGFVLFHLPTAIFQLVLAHGKKKEKGK